MILYTIQDVVLCKKRETTVTSLAPLETEELLTVLRDWQTISLSLDGQRLGWNSLQEAILLTRGSIERATWP
jgi:hypothetical protein